MTTFIRQLLKLAILAIILLFFLFVWFKFLKPSPEPAATVINQTVLLQEITNLGKLELVKYQFKDVVEYQKEQTSYQTFNRFLPKAKAVLIVHGEAVGCLDLTKIKASDIVVQEHVVSLYLPEPEICYFKVDHQNSKVYDVSSGYFVAEGEMVNEAFKAAEIQLKQSALEADILQTTKKNAQVILVPLLSKISNKKVVLGWRQANPRK